MKRVVFAAVIVSAASLGSQQGRNWQTGRVVRSDTTTEDFVHNGATGGGLLSTVIANRTTEKTTTRTVITGGKYAYTILDQQKHGRRFIIGDDVKYAQDKRKLYVLDADGKECKLDIIRQERR